MKQMKGDVEGDGYHLRVAARQADDAGHSFCQVALQTRLQHTANRSQRGEMAAQDIVSVVTQTLRPRQLGQLRGLVLGMLLSICHMRVHHRPAVVHLPIRAQGRAAVKGW